MKRLPTSRPRLSAALVSMLLLAFSCAGARAEAMLQLFNVNWDELIRKMPEIAEAGYTSLWLPPPTKGGSVFSVGYDVHDPFDLGDKDQRGTVRTRYGTKAELLRVVEIAHRFGLRVYFDNIMNHRGFVVPGYDANTPTNYYPGMVPGDFHLQRISGGFYRSWNNIGNWNDTFEIQNNPLSGLIDIAQENPNVNHGTNYKDQSGSPFIIRHPNNREYYMDLALPTLPGGHHGFNGTNGDPIAENTGAYVIRAALWLMNETKCDGFRLDAVKHTPGFFFGDYGSATGNGYCGAIQSMFDWVHGYGNNVLGNGYVEGDDNRNSNYDAEATRNDALLFGEHLGEPPSYGDYTGRGMRLLDNPLRNNLNNILGNPSASLAGYETRDGGGFSAPNRIMHAQSHDNSFATRRELQNAYYFFREGIPLIYSDGYNQEHTCDGCGDPFPRVPYAPYLGQFGDNKMPDLAWLHGQLARGGTRPRWGDADIVAFERYDYREGGSAADQTVVLFAMNDNFGNPGDISFDDDVANATDGTFYECFPVVNSKHQGLVVGFPLGSVLVQMADSPGKSRACTKLLVRRATNSKTEAENTKNAANPMDRRVYVGSQGIPSGGGAIELKIPSGGYVAYAYQWPEASRAALRDVIVFRHNGVQVPEMLVNRIDGRDGDGGFNPLYPFKMRGSVDTSGNVVRGTNVGTRTYAIDIPIVTNAAFDIVVRPDASVDNILVKLDGGIDLNSHMGMGSTNADKRDNRPGAVTDVFLGYEQARFRYRRGPEKFAATNIANNNVISFGAETYHYTVGGSSLVVVGSGVGATMTTETADWVYHQPERPVTGGVSPPATQRVPLAPGASQSAQIWVKVGYQFDIDNARIYYTTDGSNPEGSFGTGRGTTQVITMSFDHTESQVDGVVDWWRGTIPGQPNGTVVKYKVSVYDDGINPISDGNDAKRYGVTEFVITNWNPATAFVYLHNDRNTNSARTGLEEGFHIVRARAFLDRSGKASVYNTFSQTFYYDAAPPDGVIAFPRTNDTLQSQQYGVVVRADSSVTLVEYNIIDSNPANDDATTGLNNGNGSNVWAVATKVSPSGSLNTQYPNYPQEFRFNYYAVPSIGNATISVRMKEATSAVLTNRVRTLTRTVPTAAPAQTLEIAFPATDGQTISLNANESYTIVARFSDVLTANVTNFTIRIDDAVQPRFNGTNALYYFQDQTGGDGKNELRYSWTNIIPGQHLIEVAFNGNGLALEAARFVNVNIQGATVSIVQPPAADSQGRSPYQIVLPSDNGVPLINTFLITTETTTAATNVWISFSTNLFTGGVAVRDTNFIGNAARWDFMWSNIVEGTFTIRADAVNGGTNSATRVVQVIFAPLDQFRLIAPVKNGDIFSFSIQTLEGRTYFIEYTDDLANPDWQSLPDVEGDGTLQMVSNTAPGVVQRFFRFRTL
jgi:hypothetical protein